MGDFGEDTAVTETGRTDAATTFTAQLSDDWRIWTLNGGYVAAVMLRAAGAASRFDRPASISLQLLSGATSGEATLKTRVARAARVADCIAVEMNQGGKVVAEMFAWITGEAPENAPTHQFAGEVPAPPVSEVPTVSERIESLPDTVERPPFPFWNNFESRPLHWVDDWQTAPPSDPEAGSWIKFAPTATFDDPFLEAGRMAVLLDVYSYPATVQPHRARPDAWTDSQYRPPLCFPSFANRRRVAVGHWSGASLS